jgi:hypothetical protein
MGFRSRAVLQRIHEALRPLAWHDRCPRRLQQLWCYLGDLAYRGRIGDRFQN